MCRYDFGYSNEAYVSMFPADNKILKELDRDFLSFVNDVRTKEVYIPSLIKGDILEKCGYFETFPQHLSAVCSLKLNEKKLLKREDISEKNIEVHDYYLTPAACVHIYPMLEQECVENSCYTTYEKVYRYENGQFKDPERFWEFSVRELVFVGTKAFVENKIDEIKLKSLEYAKRICPSAKLENSSDTFIPTSENIIKIKIQKANNLKTELIIPIEGRDVAVASFNLHNYHFSKPFNFDNDEKIVTGCIGYGMERWSLALKYYKELNEICNCSEPNVI